MQYMLKPLIKSLHSHVSESRGMDSSHFSEHYQDLGKEKSTFLEKSASLHSWRGLHYYGVL